VALRGWGSLANAAACGMRGMREVLHCRCSTTGPEGGSPHVGSPCPHVVVATFDVVIVGRDGRTEEEKEENEDLIPVPTPLLASFMTKSVSVARGSGRL